MDSDEFGLPVKETIQVSEPFFRILFFLTMLTDVFSWIFSFLIDNGFQHSY
jgi:hypothetical protein